MDFIQIIFKYTKENFENLGYQYPIIPNEISTGWLNINHNYLSTMTLGVLEDIGYKVNYNTIYCVNPTILMWNNYN